MQAVLRAALLRAVMVISAAVALLCFAAPPVSAQPAARGLICASDDNTRQVYGRSHRTRSVIFGLVPNIGPVAWHRARVAVTTEEERIARGAGSAADLARYRMQLQQEAAALQRSERDLDPDDNGCSRSIHYPGGNINIVQAQLAYLRATLPEAEQAAAVDAFITTLNRAFIVDLDNTINRRSDELIRLRDTASRQFNEIIALERAEREAAEKAEQAEKDEERATYIAGGAAVLSVGAAFFMARVLHWPVAPVVAYQNSATGGARIFGIAYAPGDRHRLEFRTDTAGHAAALRYEYRFGGAAQRRPAPFRLDNRTAAERHYERNTLNPAGLR